VRRTRGPVTDRDRQIVRDFQAFLSNTLAVNKVTGEFVDPSLVGTDPDIVMAGRPDGDSPD
jgi:hypothetical protein